MGQSTSRPKKQPEAPPPPRQEEEAEGEGEGWGLFHNGQAISAPGGTDSQQAQEENLPPGNSTPENTEDVPRGDEIQSSASQVEDITNENEDQMDPKAPSVSGSAQDEQDERSDSLEQEPERPAETNAPGQASDSHPDNSGEETGKENVQTSKPHNVTEQDNGDQEADQMKEDHRVPKIPNRQVSGASSTKRTPHTWFDMVIDLDDPKPLGPAGYFPGPITLPDLPPLGPRTSSRVL